MSTKKSETEIISSTASIKQIIFQLEGMLEEGYTEIKDIYIDRPKLRFSKNDCFINRIDFLCVKGKI